MRETERTGEDAPHEQFDVVIVGGGHNGLTAAAYLARAGLDVLVLERLDVLGGAAVSAHAFEGIDARLSRYSYLVSLLPQQIIDDLGLDVRLVRRRYSSYTPVPGDPEGRGLLIDRHDAAATEASFAAIGATTDAAAYARLLHDTVRVADVLWPSVLLPLRTRGETRAALGDDGLWEAVFERPIGELIEDRLASDVVRGIALTDALIGTFAAASSPSLEQNRCFVYHVIGGGTGDWDVPVGGMGAITAELAAAAERAGARLLVDAEVTAIEPDHDGVTVSYRHREGRRRVRAAHVLANVAPAVLERLAGGARSRAPRPEGAQVKVNLLLSRLPRLRDPAVSPEAAFGGTFHINETYTQLQDAYLDGERGEIPGRLPCEVYCHSLSDPSILGAELAASGAHTLTVFGLHTPDRWVTEQNNDERRAAMQRAVLASLDSVLAEPIEDLLMTDAAGRPCIETKTTRDLEHTLGMPGGHIFHGPLTWPFLEDDDPRDTPARRWGVATAHDRVLLCGSGARRGGAVSGLGGHNAAMALLELLSC